MITARNAHSVVLCADQIYVIGGFSGKEWLNTVEKYNEENKTWKNVASMKHKRHYLAACAFNGENCSIYVFGGFFGGSDAEINDTIEKYDPDNNVWNSLALKLKSPLWACTAVPLQNNQIAILGGKNKNWNSEVFVLDTEEMKWGQIPSMNQAWVSHKAFFIK